MDRPIRIRARQEGSFVTVQILMPHPMETGMRQDEGGRLVPAHHITDMRVTLGERTVFAAHMSIAVSRDPLLSFRLNGARAGQMLRERDRERGVEPPATVAALWRPWRRMRLA